MNYRWLASLLVLFATVLHAQTATITWTSTHQTIDGFGASDAYRAGDIDSGKASLLFGTGSGQLGLTLLRTGIPDGNELPGDCSSVGSSCAALTPTETAVLANGGKVIASTWSPPASYKTNGVTTCTSNATLISGDYGNYANWLTNYALSLQAVGVPLYSIAMQNEPSGCNGTFASAYYSPAQIDTFITSNLGPTLAGAGLSTHVNMPDESAYYWLSISGATCGTDSSCMNYVDLVDYHDYTASLSGTNSVTAQPYPGGWIAKHYWVTEAACVRPPGTQPSFCESGYNTDITDALDWGAVIDQRLAGDNMNAFMYWWLYTPSATDDESLISDSTPYPKRAYLFAQYSKFVRPGYVRIDATRNPLTAVGVSAYKDPATGNFAIVATNWNSSSENVTFSLSGFSASTVTPVLTDATHDLATLSSVGAGGSFNYTLPARSILTFTGTNGGGSSCPASVPAGITSCHFISAGGSDSNVGTSESSPWLHAPGMPNCSANCAALVPAIGQGFIFRGNDTWHFGNSGASPYTGGTWDMHTPFYSTGNQATCLGFGLSEAGCIYFGYDTAWFSGGSFGRPILNGDNPLNTSLVSSCSYQVAGGSNNMVSAAPNSILDNFEFTGMCSQNPNPVSKATDTVIVNGGTGIAGTGMTILRNIYIHGWTATTGAGHGNNNQPGTLIGGDNNGLQGFDHIVVDGSDSNPGSWAWATFPSFYHFRDSIIRYTNQGVGQWFHDVHDNLFEHMSNHNAGAGSHTNILEFNYENDGGAPHNPSGTPNVFYNNIVRHDDPSYIGSGQVHLWFCPSATPDYWFNNLVYDVVNNQVWDYAGPPIYPSGCAGTGGQIMFNNTLVDVTHPCYVSNVGHGGQYLTVLGEHLVNTPYDTGSTQCTGGPSSGTNIAMSDATAISQGYLQSSGGTINSDTCANEGTRPCSPTSSGNSTVGASANHAAYCAYLATFTAEPAIGTDAANACLSGTTNACTYDATNHRPVCPGDTPIARPGGAWDAGAQQLGGTPTAATPVPNNAPGSYTAPLSLTFTDSTPGSSIFCTTDGSTPTPASTAYSPFTLTVTTVVQCMATASGYANSGVGGGTYTLTAPPPPAAPNMLSGAVVSQ